MASEHVGWVYRHSPARGATFAVHHAIGDSVNDQHDHEFWMTLGHLATKARLSRAAVQRAVAWLVDEGLLLNVDGVEDRRAAGHPIRYRFLFPEIAVVYETRRPRDESARSQRKTSRREREGPRDESASPRDESARASLTQEITQREETLPLTPSLAFDDFWKVYPIGNGKKAARAAWDRAVKRAPAEIIVAAAARYRDDPNRDPGHTKWAQGWLNEDRWDDPPLPERSDGRRPTATERTMANLDELMEGGANGRRRGSQTADRGSQRGLPN